MPFALVVLMALGLAGCATAGDGAGAAEPSAAAEDQADDDMAVETAESGDPLEPMNRTIYAMNEAVDVVLLRPAAVTYRRWMPAVIQSSVHNVLNYLRTPIILANDVMQGEWQRAEDTGLRFMMNSLSLGLADVAGEAGVPFHDEDFGQTLAVHGAGSGPYLVLPLLGPSNVRDTAGIAADTLLDPVTWYAYNTDREAVTIGRAAARAVDSRARAIEALDDVKASSLDEYAAIRSLYRQRREVQIRNGRPAAEESGGHGRTFEEMFETAAN